MRNVPTLCCLMAAKLGMTLVWELIKKIYEVLKNQDRLSS